MFLDLACSYNEVKIFRLKHWSVNGLGIGMLEDVRKSINLHFVCAGNEPYFQGKMAASPEAPCLLNVALILDKTEGSPINLSRLPTARESSCTTCLPCAIATS